MRTSPVSAAFLAVWMCYPAMARAQLSSETSYFESDGVRIGYLVRGSGPPVVLVHGFMVSTALNWVGPGTLDSLATRYTVVALDLRGHGVSEKPHDPSAYGMAFVDDVVRLLDHLNIQRAHVVGYSMGSVVTLKLLSMYPERVISAVLGGFGWRPPGLDPPEGVVQLHAQLERAVRGEATLADLLAASESIDFPPPVRSALNSNDLVALTAVQAGDPALHNVSETALRANATPVMVVVGELDWARPDAEQMVEVLSESQIQVIPGGTHVSTITHPQFLEIVMRFLATQ